MHRLASLAAATLLMACSGSGGSGETSTSDGTSSTGETATDSASGTSGNTTTTTDSGGGSGSSDTDSSSGTSGGSSGGGPSFVMEPDGGGANECDPRKQDCPAGEKCVAWANDGGNSWNANKCVEITGTGTHGDSCTAEGGSISGIDDCDKGHICYQVNEMGMGTCVAFCGEDDSCPTGATCANLNDGVLPICVTGCDPLLQDCPAGQGCYAVEEDETQISCRTDASGAGGADGDPCEYDNVCDPGLICAPNSAGCQTARCCTPWCDVNEPNTCPGMAMGEECVLHSENLPPGLDHAGECVIPQ